MTVISIFRNPFIKMYPSSSNTSSGSRDHYTPRQRGYKSGKSIPDRWLDYSKIGTCIAGTRFVCFKTPLRHEILQKMAQSERWSIDDLIDCVPNLGLVIDLTFTKKYYDFETFTKHGVEYRKIYCEGHVVPKSNVCQEFRDVVNEYRRSSASSGKIIGVHCTHGLNRTGYLVCRYMIDELRIPPLDAIKYFENARGHRMERENYLQSLLNKRW